MTDRFRELLERPLDPSAARAILAFAAALFLGFATLVLLAGTEGRDHPAPAAAGSSTASAAAAPALENPRRGSVSIRRHRREQDPQDQLGTAAARRADRAIRSHRALQHLPYRAGRLRVSLVGARGSRALLRVSAPSARAARIGWHRFLRRFGDKGAAYVPIFAEGRGGPRG